MYHIITHNDLDGYAAGYIVMNFLENVEGVKHDDINITFTDYSKELNLDNIKCFDEVYITDFSLKPEVMNNLLYKTKNVIWIDHHKSALEYLPEYHERVRGKQIVGMCGAALTYLYFYAPKEVMDGSIEEMEQYLNKNAKRWINLVDAWDCWKLNSKYRKQAELLSIYMSNRLSLENIEKLAMYDEDDLDEILVTGYKYQEYKRLSDENFVNRYSFEINLEIFDKENNKNTYKALVINHNPSGSLTFGNKLDKYDVCISYINNGEVISASLYSNKDYFDCSEVCKVFNGGGHKGAAGFTITEENYTLSPELMFKKDATWHLKINNWGII